MFTVPCIQSESNLLALSQAKTLFKTHHPNEEHKPRLPDSIAQPITNKPLSRMENTTFAKPSITDSHDMGLRTVYSPDTQKKTSIHERERILEKAELVTPRRSVVCCSTWLRAKGPPYWILCD
ncbi:hypothetical protein TNCV_45731 [Trichonephila clavipes]|nr:hypothetical protein TNCV_45731 [Trichonephila clavipes]